MGQKIEYKKASFTLDVMRIADKPLRVGTFKKFDNVKFTIRLSNEGIIISLKDKVVKLFAKLPDNSPVYQEVDVNIINENAGIVDIIPKKLALSHPGIVECELEVFNSDGTVLSSGEFDFLVIDKKNNLDTDEEVGEGIDFLKEIFEFSAIIKPEEEKRVASEIERNESEMQRIIDEQTRVQNEDIRVERFAIIENKVNTVLSNSEIDAIVSNALL